MEQNGLIAAIVALAALLGYMLRQLFATNQAEKKQMIDAYLSNVAASTAAVVAQTEVSRQTAKGLSDLAESVQTHSEASCREHKDLCELIQNGDPKRRG